MKYKSILLVVFLVVGLFIYLDVFQNLDTCWFDRYERKNEINFYYSEVLLVSTFIVIAMASVLVVTNNPNKNMLWNSYILYNLLYALVWHFAWFPTVTLVKQRLADKTCSQKPNSVSGHYYVHTYSLLTLLYITVGTRRPTLYTSNYFSFNFLKKVFSFKTRRQTFLIVLLYTIAVIFSIVTLFHTISLGFHSIRQSLYGFQMGLVVHFFLVLILDEVNLFNLRNNVEPISWDFPEILYYPAYARSFSSLLVFLSTLLSWGFSAHYDAFPFSTGEVPLWMYLFAVLVFVCCYEWVLRKKLIEKVRQTIKDEKDTIPKQKKAPSLAHYH